MNGADTVMMSKGVHPRTNAAYLSTNIAVRPAIAIDHESFDTQCDSMDSEYSEVSPME
jgi:hypothetical protein